MGYQLADSFTGGLYSFVGTCLILGALDGLGRFFPVLKLRASEEEEVLGIDDVEIGEFAYDYVELTRDILIPDEVDEGLSTHSHEHRPSAMGHHEKNQESIDSSNQLADWAHRG